MRTSYWIIATTTEPVDVADYGDVSGQLLNSLYEILGTASGIREITRYNLPIDACHSEIHVAYASPHRPTAVTARALVDFDAQSALSIHKPTVTSLLRTTLPFPIKVAKQFVRDEPS
ncbi:MAG: hypothetical protein CMJ58_27665 [Planctomycetaceae bacterium]|jgi:hypothetical protein|nr:hypothetical protein [Planctomycetaceae bacterium]